MTMSGEFECRSFGCPWPPGSPVILWGSVSQITLRMAQTWLWLPPRAASSPHDQHQFLQVFCDMEANGGGWTLIQRRENGSVNFQRNWKDYKEVTLLPCGGIFQPWNLVRRWVMHRRLVYHQSFLEKKNQPTQTNHFQTNLPNAYLL